MAHLTPQELQSLRAAKSKVQKYHYGSLCNKHAREKYVAMQHHLAKKYHCSISEIQAAERGK